MFTFIFKSSSSLHFHEHFIFVYLKKNDLKHQAHNIIYSVIILQCKFQLKCTLAASVSSAVERSVLLILISFDW